MQGTLIVTISINFKKNDYFAISFNRSGPRQLTTKLRQPDHQQTDHKPTGCQLTLMLTISSFAVCLLAVSWLGSFDTVSVTNN